MFNTGRRPTIIKSVVELADSGLESADSKASSNADSVKDGVWVRALKITRCSHVFGKMAALKRSILTM